MKRAPYRRLSAVHTVHNGYPRTRRRRQPGIGPWNCWATLAQCWARHDNAQHLDRQLSSTRLCPTYPCPGQPIVSKEVIIREPWGCAPTSTRKRESWFYSQTARGCRVALGKMKPFREAPPGSPGVSPASGPRNKVPWLQEFSLPVRSSVPAQSRQDAGVPSVPGSRLAAFQVA